MFEDMDLEYETRVRPRRSGGSVVVTIPREIVSLLGLRPKEELSMRVFRTTDGRYLIVMEREGVSRVGAEVSED